MTKMANKIILINGRRTSMRLCHKEWSALDDVCMREKIHRNHLIELIEDAKNQELGLTYSTRLFLMLYYKSVAKPPKPQTGKSFLPGSTVAAIIKELV